MSSPLNMETLAIIPARAGSKGIPMKNITRVAGKPLIEYSIKSARKAELVNRIIVSTDSTKIAQISKRAGAEAPFLRPKEISRSSSSTLDVIIHTLMFLKKNESYSPDVVTILQPTSPLRTPDMIDKSICLLKKSKASSVVSVAKIKTHPYGAFWYNDDYLKPFKKNFEKFDQRQKYPDLYYTTGSIYTMLRKTIEKYNSLYGPRIKPIIDNGFTIDIDDYYDLFIAEMLIVHGKISKKD